jgi:hypothetical protein
MPPNFSIYPLLRGNVPPRTRYSEIGLFIFPHSETRVSEVKQVARIQYQEKLECNPFEAPHSRRSLGFRFWGPIPAPKFRWCLGMPKIITTKFGTWTIESPDLFATGLQVCQRARTVALRNHSAYMASTICVEGSTEINETARVAEMYLNKTSTNGFRRWRGLNCALEPTFNKRLLPTRGQWFLSIPGEASKCRSPVAKLT